MKHIAKLTAFLFLLFLSKIILAQNTGPATGLVIGSILDAENSKAIQDAGVTIMLLSDTSIQVTQLSNANGEFILDKLGFGFYRLRVTAVGYSALLIDSIHIRAERFDFDLNDIKLKKNAAVLNEVIVFAEKPLIENKDGKIIFNTGESALSSGATTTELLKQTPLVNVDNDGKILLRGKEVKILIDDKPVELDSKQLQDLMESMPGSMIEKIEVMTTPPPQYANERGGVINIVTKKGKVGFNGRVSINYGSRGEAAINGNISYRKNKLALNFSSGFGYNIYNGNSYSNRQNFYTDSSNYFNTIGESSNNNRRPNLRMSLDYDLSKQQSMNFTVMYNSNNSAYENIVTYSNADRNNQVYKLSNRNTATGNNSQSPVFNFTYTIKGKNPKNVFKFISGFNYNAGINERNFYQEYLNPDNTPTGSDSTQQQITNSHNTNINLRMNYDKSLKNNKTSLHFGATYNGYNNHNVLNTAFMKKPENVLVNNAVLSNDFRFHQTIYGVTASVRYDFIPNFYVNGGMLAEYTQTYFDIKNNSNRYLNNYWSLLPFANLVKKWKNDVSITFTYRRTVQRPRLNELNPSVDYGDPYNTRSGNPYVQPYYADNFDFIFGKWNKKYNFNVSVGYNALQKIYSSIRTLQPDGSTFTTWQNISGRKEYEASAWGGYTLTKKAKANLSFGYNYNVYSLYDRNIRRFRNGGSFYSTLNGSYQFTTLMNANASFTFNRFANPQGSVRSTLSMNIGVQQKFFKKKITVTFNIIDPFRQQQNKNFTYGSNFNLESFSTTNTRNYRLVLSYTFKMKEKKSGREALLKSLQKK
ncbi:MAG: outer membrane beta-barrel protein [Chitinophagaceae bacterium]|nr:outer membrane beta-barrel protein [Chitinophagaceae bacterium]